MVDCDDGDVAGIYFDETVLDYSDSLNAVVYRQEPDYGEEPLLMGMDISLFLTTDLDKVPDPEEMQADSLDTAIIPE